MPDVVSPEVRSRMMAGIRGTNTRPELILRKGLHARGLRFRLHDKALPGKPDMVFPRLNAVLFAHGCFWHGHDCHLFRWPATRKEFWRAKIERNQQNDAAQKMALSSLGWRYGVVWECALKGRARLPLPRVLERTSTWLFSNRRSLNIRGRF